MRKILLYVETGENIMRIYKNEKILIEIIIGLVHWYENAQKNKHEYLLRMKIETIVR